MNLGSLLWTPSYFSSSSLTALHVGNQDRRGLISFNLRVCNPLLSLTSHSAVIRICKQNITQGGYLLGRHVLHADNDTKSGNIRSDDYHRRKSDESPAARENLTCSSEGWDKRCLYDGRKSGKGLWVTSTMLLTLAEYFYSTSLDLDQQPLTLVVHLRHQ